MALYIFLALIGIPLLEIWVFIEVGSVIGAWTTIGIVLATGIAGTALLRIQGLGVLTRAREAVERGEMPVAEVFDGLCLLVAGALLLTPGFVTDAVGMLLFVPAFRLGLGRWLMARLIASGHVWVDGRRSGPGAPGPGRKGSGPIIDGDYTETVETPDGNANGGTPPISDSRWGRN